jgi:large subunit ribosomal protein L17
MRHQNKINQLGRKTAHRHALLSNLAAQLIEHKRINTTVAKAKALRIYVEPLITKSKNDTTHNRRTVFSLLQNKNAVAELFREVATKVGSRPGGYTRIIKTGFRAGDSAEMCMIELVDFNELYVKEAKAGAKKTRRSRRSGAAAEETVAKPEKKAKASVKTAKPAAEAAESKADVAPSAEPTEPEQEEPKA